jgi:hypothetical protein
MKTQTLELESNHASLLQALQKELRSQDELFTRAPLYCVYTRENESDPQDGEGWPVSIFLTHDTAHNYIEATRHRNRNAYIYVRSPGEDSELHALHLFLKESASLGNGPFVEEES